MWSSHLGRTALNVPELRPTAWSSPAQSLFPQVSALPGPNWQSKGQGFESPQLHSCGDVTPQQVLAGQAR
jgi:hypothetical protein